MTESKVRVAAVVLTYNSIEDLPACLAGLTAQTGVDLRVIVVDNASRPEARAQMEADFLAAIPEGRILPASEARPEAVKALPGVFLRNEANGGYSAGNNIGARMAAAIGCDAVLIVNPDMRINNPGYTATLAALITADPKTAVACSTLRSLSGAQENPMTEPGFVEELLWPAAILIGGIFSRRRRDELLPKHPFPVKKVSGACFMIRTDFLQRIGFFDEAVFLYCEESILMAQVQAAGWRMMMEPRIDALHAHRSAAKGDPLPRFHQRAASRAYFHKAHTHYGPVQRMFLETSRRAALGLVRMRAVMKRLGS